MAVKSYAGDSIIATVNGPLGDKCLAGWLAD